MHKFLEIATVLIIFYILCGCKAEKLSLMQGDQGILNFPFPCDSTAVTLQYSHRLPFYQSTNAQSLSLPQGQANRFKVQTHNNTENCFLTLTISNLMRDDEGTYILSVFMDGEIVVEDTYRIWLGIQYPPGKASCVEGGDKDGEWKTIECTAEVGSLSGNFECFQNGELMPSLTNPVETQNKLMQSIIVRKSQPTFCCSCILNEKKERCECNDSALYLDDGIKEPCPTISTMVAMPLIYDGQENTQTEQFSTPISNTSTKMKEHNCKKDNNKSVIVHSIFVPIEVILLLVNILVFHKQRGKPPKNNNCKEPPNSGIPLLNGETETMTNGSITNGKNGTV